VSTTANIQLEPVIIYTQTVMRGTDSAALATTLAGALGADGKALISTDAQDLKTTLTVGSYLKGILATALTETGGYLAAGFKMFFNVATPVATAETVNQTGDSYAVVAHADHGNAQLVRSTTPANKLDVSATGEAGLDFNNIKAATGATTLTNITVPSVTTVGTTTTNTDMVTEPPTTAQIVTAMEDVGTILAALDAVKPGAAPPTNAELTAVQAALTVLIDALNDLSAAATAAAILDAASAAHLGAGTIGAKIASSGAHIDVDFRNISVRGD